MDSQLDPLRNKDVQRVLSFARARELYPGLSRDDLRECCEAAWLAACAEPDGADLTQRFDRALVLVVWARRGSRTRMPLTDLVDQTIPRIALEPFLSRATAPAEPAEAPVTAPPRAPDRTAAQGMERQARRIPFASPIPAGAAVAAGAVGVAMLGATEGLPVTPLSPASSEDDGGDDRAGDPAAPEAAAPVAPPASEPAPLAPALDWGGLADAADQAGEGPGAEAGAVEQQAAVANGEGPGDDSVSAPAATEPVAAPEAEPVMAPAPEPPAVPAPSVTATGPSAPAPIQVRRPEPPVLVQVRAPVEAGDEPGLTDEVGRPEGTGPGAVEGEIEVTDLDGDAIETGEDLAEQGVEVPAPVDPAVNAPPDVAVPADAPVVEEVPPIVPEEPPAETPPVAPEQPAG